MAISDNKINNFFSKHKVGSLSSLKEKKDDKVLHHKNDSYVDNNLPVDLNLLASAVEINTSIEKSLIKTNNISSDPVTSSKKPIINNEKTATGTANISEQNVSNSLASSYQHVSKSLATSEQNVSNSLASSYQHVSKSLAIGEQNVSKTLAQSLAKFNELEASNNSNILTIYSNKEIELLYIIYEKCALNCEQVCTVYSQELTNRLGVSTNRVRNLFSRIIKKGEVTVLNNKRGLNALRIVGISNILYKNLHEMHGTSLANSLATTSYSSSSNINTTTTKTNIENEIIDISLLSEYGFVDEHKSQLLRMTSENNPLNPEVIQNSINYFYYDLKYNNKEKEIKKTPVQFFMGIMRNEKIYNPPKNYKSQSEIAMDIILNQKTEELERFNKKIEALKKAQCDEWLENLDSEEKLLILSTKTKEHNHTPEIAFLKIHYSNNIWPEVKNSLLEMA
ncbi:MAG: hypothetical protein KBD64_05640 [Gammaproteobacteria bacterium]|nr:hypothetical protein [Gammaproteobacteria bacterium]